MPPFVHRESYTHRCAKEIFKEWCGELRDSNGGNIYFQTECGNRVCGGYGGRKEPAWLEYPVVVDGSFSSVTNAWDEIWPGFHDDDDDDGYFNDFVPTYDQCVAMDMYPKAVVDVVTQEKGTPTLWVEICHKNPVSDEKLRALARAGVSDLIELDANWIMRQTDVPEKLRVKRWLL